MAASVSGATICLQKPGSKGRRARDATSFARRSVAAPRSPHAAKASVIRSDAGAGRGQHCSPLRAVVDAAPIATKKVYILQLLETEFARHACNWREHFVGRSHGMHGRMGTYIG
jgi:hypothetical protein